MSSYTDVCEHGRVLFYSLFCVPSKFIGLSFHYWKREMCVEIQAVIQPGKLCIFQIIYLFVVIYDHHDHCVVHCSNSHGLG